MELTQLVFNVDTSQLLNATNALGNLQSAMQSTNTAATTHERAAHRSAKAAAELAKAESEAAEAASKAATAQNELALSAAKVAKEAERAAKAKEREAEKVAQAAAKAAQAENALDQAKRKSNETTKETMSLLEKQNLILKYRQEGFTKEQAMQLANAAAQGKSADEVNRLIEVYRQHNAISQRATESTNALAAAKDQAAVASAKLAALIAKEASTLDFMSKEYSKGQSSVLAYAKSLGATEEQLEQLGTVLRKQRELMGVNPFDNSNSGLITLTQSYKELIATIKHYNRETGLNSNQVSLLIRDKERLIERMKHEGATTEEITRAIQQQEREFIALANKYNALEASRKKHEQGLREQANAAKSAAAMEEKLTAAVGFLSDEMNQAAGFTEKYARELALYERHLRTAKVSQEELNQRMADYKKNLAQVAAAETEQRGRYAARAVGVQMGDVGVSLASGQNPLIVAIQQGDQLRMFIQDAIDAGVKLDQVMRNALVSIAEGFKNVGVAVGAFVAGGLASLGRGFANLGGQLFGFNKAIDLLGDSIHHLVSKGVLPQSAMDSMVRFEDRIKNSRSVMIGFGVVATATIGAVVAFTAELYKAAKASDELNKSLELKGAGLGMTLDEATKFAVANRAYGTSIDELKGFLGALANEGFRSKESLAAVSASAQRYALVTGKSLEDVAKLYGDLGKDPVDALLKIGKETGKVDAATILYVDSLIKAGDKTAATTKATLALASALDQAAKDIEDSQSGLAKIMQSLSETTAEVWSAFSTWANSDAVVNGIQKIIGVVQILTGQIIGLGTGLYKLSQLPQAVIQRALPESMGGNNKAIQDWYEGAKTGLGTAREAIITGVDNYRGVKSSTSNTTTVDANQAARNRILTEILEKERKYVKESQTLTIELNTLNKQREALRKNPLVTKTELDRMDKLIASVTARKKKAEQSEVGSGASGSGEATFLDRLRLRLDAVKTAANEERDVYSNKLRFLELFNKQGLVSIEQYYKAQQETLADNNKVQLKAVEDQLKIVQTAKATKGLTGKDQLELSKQEAALIHEKTKLIQSNYIAQAELNHAEVEGTQKYADSMKEAIAQAMEFNGQLKEAVHLRASIQFDAEISKHIQDGNIGLAEQARLRKNVFIETQNLAILQKDISKVETELSRREAYIGIDKSKGLLSEFDATVKLNSARQEAITKMQRLVDEYDELKSKSELTDEQRQRFEELGKAYEDMILKIAELSVKIESPYTKLFENLESDLANWLVNFEGGLKGLANAFANTMQRMAAEEAAANLFRSFKQSLPTGGSGGLLGLAGSLLGGLFGGGSTPTPALSGIDFAGAVSAPSGLDFAGALGGSFAGGGYTGDSSRSGGLDGQGGFLAMLHPQETVVDHAKGQSVSNSSNVVNNIKIEVHGQAASKETQAQIANRVAAVMSKGQRNR